MDALKIAQENLSEKGAKFNFVHDNFRNIKKILDDLNIKEVDGMLFDLGVSSLQLDDPDRGFSFRGEGPLDMRMNQEGFISAYDLINSLSEHEISKILKEYGQERWHKRIARYIVAQRPIQSTTELSKVAVMATPAQYRRQKIHPATKTFQAFRIAVNRELESIEIALDKAIDFLKPGGRICVISFHSLEDRIAKIKFREFARNKRAELITKKPIFPQEDETISNPRARSARLRVVQKI